MNHLLSWEESQIDLFCLTSHNIHLASFLCIIQKLDYLNYRLWGFIQIIGFSDNGFNIVSRKEKFGRKIVPGIPIQKQALVGKGLDRLTSMSRFIYYKYLFIILTD